MPRGYQPGDRIVYVMPKHSPAPGPRAQEVRPAARGDDYAYHVDKYWIVEDVQPDGQLVVRTRRGKRHVLAPDDPLLRHASWWERIRYRHRFPILPPDGDSDQQVPMGP